MADGPVNIAAKAAAEAIANKLVQEHQDNSLGGGGMMGMMGYMGGGGMQFHPNQHEEMTNKRKFQAENGFQGGNEFGDVEPMRKKTFADNMPGPPMQQLLQPQLQQGNGGDDGKSHTSFIDIPEKLVGKLIGRNGETIQTVEKTTGCKLQVEHNSHSDPRRVSISGTSMAQVESAKKTISSMIEGTPLVQPGGVLPHPTVGGQAVNGGIMAGDVKIVVPCSQSMVGRVIGRQGDTIRALQQASQAKIVVNQDFPDGVPREVHISGKGEAVDRAENMIKELIDGKATSVQSVIIKFGIGETRVMQCPKNMVGKVIGKGGETIKNLQRETGASVQIDQTTQPCKITITGTPANVEKAIEQLEIVMYALPPNYGNSHQSMPSGMPGDGGMVGGGGGGGGQQGGFQVPYGYVPQQGGYGGYGGPGGGGGAGPPSNFPAAYYQQAGQYPGQFPQQGSQMYGQSPYATQQPNTLMQPGNAPPFQNQTGGFPGGGGGGGAGNYGGAGMPVATQGVPVVGGMMGQNAGANAGVDNQQVQGGVPPANQPPPPRQSGVWQELFDQEHRPYYYNMTTGVSQWEKPPEFQQGGGGVY